MTKFSVIPGAPVFHSYRQPKELPYSEIWVCDTEYRHEDGNTVEPVCAVFLEILSGKEIRLWAEKGQACPVKFGRHTLFVAYAANAEMSYFLEMGWEIPPRVLDLYAEYRAASNDAAGNPKSSLVDAMAVFGISDIDSTHKEVMRSMILDNREYTDEQHVQIMDYCASDVYGLTKLLGAMLPIVDLTAALFRGRYMCAVARVERNGIPIDTATLKVLRDNWEAIKRRLIETLGASYGVYVDGAFSAEKFAEWLVRNNMPWPRLPSGKLELTEEVFRDRAKADPRVAPLHELRTTLSSLRLNALTVGKDGRNRFAIMPFRSKTSRNQPSNARSVYGPSIWIRGLIKPAEGFGLAYCDWSSQELGIAAAISGDTNMTAAYLAGDFYLAFAEMAKAVPPGATKESHPVEREKFKTVALGVLFGQTEHGISAKLNVTLAEARNLLNLHKETFKTFWKWSEETLMLGSLHMELWTPLRWPLHVCGHFRANTLRNFPIQGAGGDMMRVALCLATEAGLKICCPVHDAFLLEAPLEKLDADTAALQEIMSRASAAILPGLTLRSAAEKVLSPNRYMDEKRGRVMWDQVQDILANLPKPD